VYPIHHQQTIIISNVSRKGKEQGIQQCLRKRRMQKNQRRHEARHKKKVLDALHISGATVKLRKEFGHWMHYMPFFPFFFVAFL
jgi:hypothetical protein